MSKGQFIYRVFETRDGEREYSHKSVHDFQEEKTTEEVNKFLDEECSTFWGENTGEERPGEYWFFNEIITRVYTWEFITEEEYNVLRKYII
jgi:hypothetical protein